MRFKMVLAATVLFLGLIPISQADETIPAYIQEACRANLQRVESIQLDALAEYPEKERKALLRRSFHLFGVWLPDIEHCGVVNIKEIDGYAENLSKEELLQLVLSAYREAGFSVGGRLSADGTFVQLYLET